MGHYILKEAIEYTKTQTKINSRKLQLQFKIGYHVADHLITAMNNGGLIKIDNNFPHLKDYVVVRDSPKQIPIMPPDISGEYARILSRKIEHYGETRFAYEVAASEFATYHHEFYTEYNKLNPKSNGAVLDTQQIQIMENKESNQLEIGSMVWYQSNPKTDARELGSHNDPIQYPALIIRKGKAENTLNLTVFVDNEGIGDAYHRASGTMSRINVPHVENKDPNKGCWAFKGDANIKNIIIDGLTGAIKSFDGKIEEANDDETSTLLKLVESFGFEVAPKFTKENLQDLVVEYNSKLERVRAFGWNPKGDLTPTINELNDLLGKWDKISNDLIELGIPVLKETTFEEMEEMWQGYLTQMGISKKYGFEIDDLNLPRVQDLDAYILEADAKKALLKQYGYEIPDPVTAEKLEEMLTFYFRDLETAKELGLEASEDDDVTIQVIQKHIKEHEDLLKEKAELINKLTKTGHAEAGYLDGEPTIEKLRDLDASYEKELSNAYDAGLKKKTAKNAKLYTLTQINEALGIKAG